MNPLTNVKNIQRINKRELELGLTGKQSWHYQYRESAWIFIGGLDFEFTEGDVICVFSQYGEIVCINLVRDHKTGKSKGFAFICYDNQQSTVLAVDNLNGTKLAGRIIRVDHVEEYKVPKMKEDMDPDRMKLAIEGCAPKEIPIVDNPPIIEIKLESPQRKTNVKKKKKEKKSKEKKKEKKKKRRHSTSEDSSNSSDR